MLIMALARPTLDARSKPDELYQGDFALTSDKILSPAPCPRAR